MMYTPLAMKGEERTSTCCPVYRIIDSCSRKWAMHILRAMSENKTMRFSEIKNALPEINSRILSERLSELEEKDLIKRNVIESKPITIEYEITQKGMDLKKVFDAFCSWAKKWDHTEKCDS